MILILMKSIFFSDHPGDVGIGMKKEPSRYRNAACPSACWRCTLQGEQICGKSVRALAAEHHLVERQVARIVADVAF